ncbi:hypothetical protein S245_063107, partial [Arachis hypogaea]
LICFWASLLIWQLRDPLCWENLFLELFLLMELAFISLQWLYLREDLSCCPQHLSSIF